METSALPCWVYWGTHSCTNKLWDWGVLNVVVVSWEQVIFAVAEDMSKGSIADTRFFFFLFSPALPLRVAKRGISAL